MTAGHSLLRRRVESPDVAAARFPGMETLHGVILRGFRCPGTFSAVSIDPPRKGSFLFSAADVPGENRLRIGGDTLPLFSDGQIRFPGEPIGIVVADTHEEALDALSACQIRYELESDTGAPETETVALEEREHGDVAARLGEAYHLVQASYETSSQIGLRSEPLDVVAEPRPGGVSVYTTSRWPYHLRLVVAEALGLETGEVRVVCPRVSRSSDGYLWYPSLLAARAAVAAVRLQMPVRLHTNAEERYNYGPARAPSRWSFTTALDQGGNVQGMEVDATFDLGAYPLFTGEIVSRVLRSTRRFYRCENVKVTVRAIRSPFPPMTSYSGFGSSQTQFALESNASRLAEVSQGAPDSWRLENLPKEQRQRRGSSREAPHVAVIQTVTKASDFGRKYAAYQLQRKRRDSFTDRRGTTRGIGIAVASQNSTLGSSLSEGLPATVRLRLDRDGGARVSASAVVESQGINDVWRESVARQLGIDAEAVSFMPLDTELVPDSGPSTLSRNLTVITRLLDNCAKAINRRRFHHGLPLEASRSFRTAESAAARDADPRHDSVAATVVEVELDTATLRFSIRGIWMAIRAGHVLRPDYAKRQTEVAILDALRWTSGAITRQKRGEESPAPFGDFRHARSVAVEDIFIEFLPEDDDTKPRGIGELPYLTIPGAVAAAVTQASNHYVDAIPITPELLHGYEESE